MILMHPNRNLNTFLTLLDLETPSTLLQVAGGKQTDHPSNFSEAQKLEEVHIAQHVCAMGAPPEQFDAICALKGKSDCRIQENMTEIVELASGWGIFILLYPFMKSNRSKKRGHGDVEMLISVPTKIHAAMVHSSGRNEWLQARTLPASARAPLDSAAFAEDRKQYQNL